MESTINISSISPGKIILFGEHFVVFDYSSIVAAIDKKFNISLNLVKSSKEKIKVISDLGFSIDIIDSKTYLSGGNKISPYVVKNLNRIIQYFLDLRKMENPDMFDLTLHLNSELPLGGGLGSSSAFCVALAGAIYYHLNHHMNKKIICEWSIEAEKKIYNDTSGADCNICTFGGLGIYDKNKGFKKLDLDVNNIQFLIIDTGISHNTFEMVQKVKKYKENDPESFKNICMEYENIFKSSIKSLTNNDLENLGILMNQNHNLLTRFSISTPAIDKVVQICKTEGSLGTKITGAGGGGCMLSLIDNSDPVIVNRLLERLSSLNLNYFFTNLDHNGLVINNNLA